MTTARDVIAEWLMDWSVARTMNQASDMADTLIDRLFAAAFKNRMSDSARLELAALLNPWRPIETAPKDGSRFLALALDGAVGIVSIIHRHAPGTADRNPRHHYECWVTDFNSPCGLPPEKWLPLPAPPPEDKAP